MLDLSQKNDQQVVDLLKALARAYLENGENLKAVVKYKQLVDQGIEDPETLRNYALALARMQLIHEEALHVYRKAVAADLNDEALYLTLSTLFLKENLTDDPALKVYQRSLKFTPPFEEEIRGFLEKIFQDAAKTLSIAELLQTLLDAKDDPELLYLYLLTAWQQKNYDQTLDLLNDLYSHTQDSSIYLKALCETLFEKQSNAEEKGLEFNLSSTEAQYFLKYKSIEESFSRIKEIEFYLDLKNLCLALPKDARGICDDDCEYEFFVADNVLQAVDHVPDARRFEVEFEPSFDLIRDFIEKFGFRNPSFSKSQPDHELMNSNAFDLINQINCVAIFEITNIAKNPQKSNPAVTTFHEAISEEMTGLGDMVLCKTEDGLITFFTNLREVLNAALNILKQLEKRNRVVGESEKIEVRITIHSTTEPFIRIENQGLTELRRAFKIHNVDLNNCLSIRTDLGKGFSGRNLLLISEPIANRVKGLSLKNLGEVRLPHFVNKQSIYAVLWKKTTEEVKSGMRRRFGRFEVSETIKENQLCSTFRGFDPLLGRPVIIKAYKAPAFAGFKDFTQLRKQFYEEVRKLNRIVHPNVAVIYDAGEDGNVLYLVREYINGMNLNDYAGQQELPDINKTLQLYLQIITVLSQYHKNQIWHKNLKPNNIILIRQNEIKLTDGGLLQVRHVDKVWHDDIESQCYTSPEQIQGLNLTQSCDVFSLGILLYESLTGTYPFWAEHPPDIRIKILVDAPVPASNLRNDLPKSLDVVLAKALAKSPRDRYQSVYEFASALQGVYGERQVRGAKRMVEILDPDSEKED
jgi:serine/threonine protein kinase